MYVYRGCACECTKENFGGFQFFILISRTKCLHGREQRKVNQGEFLGGGEGCFLFFFLVQVTNTYISAIQTM